MKSLSYVCCLLVATAATTALAPCQVPGRPGQKPPAKQGQERGGSADQQAGELRRRKMQAAMEQEERENIEWEKLSPEERLSRRVVTGASSYCRFQASCKPAKLLPGQSGTLMVVAILQGSAVLPSPAPVEVMPRQGVTPVSLGTLRVRPAERGQLAKAYVGQPVYDNTAIFEVPVTMSSDAKLGEKHLVSLDLKFDLYDGNSGQPVGRFIDRVATNIEVGAVPNPTIQGGGASAANNVDTASTARVVKPVAVGGGDTPTVNTARTADVDGAVEQAASGDANQVEPVAPALGGGSQPPVADDSEDGLPIGLIAGGGLFVVAILVLLLRRKS